MYMAQPCANLEHQVICYSIIFKLFSYFLSPSTTMMHFTSLLMYSTRHIYLRHQNIPIPSEHPLVALKCLKVLSVTSIQIHLFDGKDKKVQFD